MALTNGGFELSFMARATQLKTDLGSGPLAGMMPEVLAYLDSYEPGSGENRVNRIYGAYTAGLSQLDLDLQGSLTGPFGDTISFPIVMGIFVKNLSKTAGQNILIGGGTNPVTSWVGASGDIVKVGPGGLFALWSPIDGYTTTASTADILRLDPSSGTPPCAYLLIGRSA